MQPVKPANALRACAAPPATVTLTACAWKKLAKSDQLVSRNMELPQHRTLWLDLLDCGLPAGSGALLEQRLSRLCAWVLAAHQQQRVYGLRLPGLTLAPGSGPAQRDACLQALALYQQAP